MLAGGATTSTNVATERSLDSALAEEAALEGAEEAGLLALQVGGFSVVLSARCVRVFVFCFCCHARLSLHA